MESDQSNDFINEICKDMIATALEAIGQMVRNIRGELIKPVWAPWHDNSETMPLVYKGQGSLITAADNLPWINAKELAHNGFFNHRTTKEGKTNTRRSVSIRILYNGLDSERETIRKNLQESIRNRDKDAQVWLSRLQTCANPSKVGRIFYSTASFDLSPIAKRISNVIYKETNRPIEITIVAESAFEDEKERKTWYETHDTTTAEAKEELSLRKVPTIYCEAKWTTVVGLHFLQAFSSNPPTKYLTNATEQRFVPTPGALVCYNPKRQFQAYLTDTAKLTANAHTIITVPGFNAESFFNPLSLDPKNPFHGMSPYTILNAMPRNNTDKLPAFFQIGKVTKEKEIHAICIPALSSIAAAYGRKAVHYLAAKLEEIGGKAYLDRILTPEAVVEISQYKYDLTNHEVKPIDIEIPDDNEESKGLQGWEQVENPLMKIAQVQEYEEVGSVVSKLAVRQFKARSALSPTPKIKQTEQKNPQLTYKETKAKVKLALKAVSKSKFGTHDLTNDIKGSDIKVIPTLEGLLGGKGKTAFDRDHIPIIYRILHRFCIAKKLYRPEFKEETESSREKHHTEKEDNTVITKESNNTTFTKNSNEGSDVTEGVDKTEDKDYNENEINEKKDEEIEDTKEEKEETPNEEERKGELDEMTTMSGITAVPLQNPTNLEVILNKENTGNGDDNTVISAMTGAGSGNEEHNTNRDSLSTMVNDTKAMLIHTGSESDDDNSVLTSFTEQEADNMSMMTDFKANNSTSGSEEQDSMSKEDEEQSSQDDGGNRKDPDFRKGGVR
jgi:hypothetical protein